MGLVPVTKIKIAVFCVCEDRRKSLRRPSGFDPEFMCCFFEPPFRVLIISSLVSAEAEAVVFIFSLGRLTEQTLM